VTTSDADSAPDPGARLRVGDVVHYVSYGTPGGEYLRTCRAAVVTEVSSWLSGSTLAPLLGLCVLNPTGVFFRTLSAGGCAHDPAAAHARLGGTWHRPAECDGAPEAEPPSPVA
jgi:hypothetical protein